MSEMPKEYADQYWADMDRELAAWFDEDPVDMNPTPGPVWDDDTMGN